MKSVRSMGYFAKGMILLHPSSDEEYVVKIIHDIDKKEHTISYLHEMIAKGMFLEFENGQFLYTDDDWNNFPEEIKCKNSDEFLQKGSFNN